MNDHMKEAERLLSEYGDAVSDVVVFAQDPAGYSMRVEATRAALLAHIQRGAVPEALDPEFLIGYLEVREDWRGREFLIERIRQAAAPDQFRDATKMMAAPAGVPMPKPVAYGFGNTAITGHTNRLMMVRIDIPGDDQYAGAFWLPLVLADEARTYGDAREAAGYAAGVAAVRDYAVMRWYAEVSNRPLVNMHRRTLDDTWRQVIRHTGGDPETLIGPCHDALVAMRGEVKS